MLWVDDLVLLAPTAAKMQPVKKALSEDFEMKDLGCHRWWTGKCRLNVGVIAN